MKTTSTLRRAILTALTAHLVLALAACGPDDPSGNNDENNSTENNSTENNSTENNTSTNNTSTNNTSTNNTSTNNTSTNNTSTNNTSTNNTSTNNTSTNNTSTNNTSTNNTSTNNTSTNNTSTNNTSTNNSTNLCADVTCDPKPAECDGAEAVTYEDGVCNPEDGMCEYAVASRMDCAADGRACVDGACVTLTPEAPAVGDLVITELMYDSDKVNDDFGEWFEVYNKTNKLIDLRGLTIEDDGGNTFTIDAMATGAEIPPRSYFVFGASDVTADAAPEYNGGVDVDLKYDGVGFGNGGDTVALKNGAGDVIAEVVYDNDTGWDDPKGSSIQFDGALDIDADYEAVPQKWCEAPEQWDAANDSDFGSPGEANPACPPPPMATEVTIYDLQDTTSADHPAEGTQVLVKGVVLSALGTDEDGNPHAFAQDPMGGAYSGVYLDIDPTMMPMMAQAGSSLVDVEGAYEEAFDNTQIAVTSITVTGTAAAPLEAEVVSSMALADPAEAEKWEGVLVRVREAGITNENPDDDGMGRDYGEFIIDNNVRGDDLIYQPAMGDAEANCDLYEFIQGPLNYSFGTFKIEPRGASDFGAKVAVPLSDMSTPTIDYDGAALTPANACVYLNDAVTFANSSGADVQIVSRDPATGMAAAMPAIDVNVPAGTSLDFDATEAGTFHVSAGAATGAAIVLDQTNPNMMMMSNVQPGDLLITEIMYDSAESTDSDGEWFELYNGTANPIDLNGLIFADGAASHTVTTSVVIAPGSYAVLTNQSDMMLNGGVQSDYTYSDAFALNNGNNGDTLTISAPGGVVIDAVQYGANNGFVDPTGASIQLTSGPFMTYVNAATKDNTVNDNGAGWCGSTQTWGAGMGKGTPGQANDDCPMP